MSEPTLTHAQIEALIERAFESNRKKNMGILNTRFDALEKDILEQFNSAFPQGPEKHHAYHQEKIDEAVERKDLKRKFWNSIAAGLAAAVLLIGGYMGNAVLTSVKSDLSKSETKK